MVKKNFEAYRKYESAREGIEKEILSYFLDRVRANEQEIKELIEIKKEAIRYEEIIKIIEEEKEENIEYKKSSYWVITPSNFMHAVVEMPIGVIGVEASKAKNAIKYWLKAVTSHNAIVVIDKEYDEFDVKHFILNLLQIVLKKYELSENLVERIPYEESIDEEYQKIIKVNEEETEKIEYRIQEKEKAKEKIVYLEDRYFEKEVEDSKEPNQIVWKGEYEEVLKRINQKQYEAASVYTQNAQIAYQAINEIKSPIVFINTSLKNQEYRKEITEEAEGIEKEFYHVKNIVFPYQNSINVKAEENKKEEVSGLNEKDDEEKVLASEEKAMVKYEKRIGILEKIKNIFEKIFTK